MSQASVAKDQEQQQVDPNAPKVNPAEGEETAQSAPIQFSVDKI